MRTTGETVDRRAEVIAKLTAGIEALTSSERWTEWLSMQRRFHTYSFNNSLLIAMQCPAASRVAGFRTWLSLGRSVRKGEKGIWILAPSTRRVEDPETDETRSILTGFRPVPVFDISQTDGEELPEVASLLTGDDAGLFDRLALVAAKRSLPLEFADLGSTNGLYNRETRVIRINAHRTRAQQAKTLAHELAHSILHEGGYAATPRELAELEAESVAYIVCGTEGLDSGDYSFGYVAGWSGGGEQAITTIKDVGQRIHDAANAILSDLGNTEAGTATQAA
jgi:hypothetical protein